MASAFDNSLAQLETSWGKLRASWTPDDWQHAATVLENALAVTGNLILKQERGLSSALQMIDLLRNPPPRRKGRRPTVRRQVMGMVRVPEKPQERRQRSNYSLDDYFFFAAAVKAKKIRAMEGGKKLTTEMAIWELFKNDGDSIYGNTRRKVTSKLAPLHSRGLKKLKTAVPAGLDEKVKAAADGLLKSGVIK